MMFKLSVTQLLMPSFRSRLVAYLPDTKDLSMLTRDSAIADGAKPKNEPLCRRLCNDSALRGVSV